MCISIIVVTVMYISINVAYLSVLGEDGVMTSPAVAGVSFNTFSNLLWFNRIKHSFLVELN